MDSTCGRCIQCNQPPTTPVSNNNRCFPNGLGAEFSGVSSGGNWSHSESKHHINYLEMLAILLGLQTFAKEKSDTHIRIMCDNTTAVTVVNHMGTSHSDSCNSEAKEIWEWCIDCKIWLSAAHIPGKQNLIADFESCRNQRASEWRLDRASLICALQRLHFKPDVDLFASRINHQFPLCVLQTRPRGYCH